MPQIHSYMANPEASSNSVLTTEPVHDTVVCQ